jgi:AcrR family transcriptional regulator
VVEGNPGWTRARRSSGRKARDAVVDAALALFSEHGYVGVRVEDIAKAAGVSRATFYKYFAERDEILAELFARLLGDAPPAIDQSKPVAGEVERVLRDTALRMTDQRDLARFVYTLPVRHAAVAGPDAATPAVFGALAHIVAAGIQRGELRDDVPPEVIVDALARAFEAGMRDWAEGRAADAPDRVSLLVDLVLRGALHSPPRRKTRSRS